MEKHSVFGEELNIMEYWALLKKRKKILGVIFVAGMMCVTVYTFTLPNLYKADATILPVGESNLSSGLAMLAIQLGGGMRGGAQSNQQLSAIMESRTLAEEIVRKHNLVDILVEDQEGSGDKFKKAVNHFRGSVRFEQNVVNNTFIISAVSRDPKVAADLVNFCVKGLEDFIRKGAFTSAKRHRMFLETQLAESKRELLEAGKGLNEFYQGGKISSVESKIDVPVALLQHQRDQQTTGSHLESNLQSDLESLVAQKEEIEGNMIVKNVPQQVYLQYLTLRRNLLAQINTLLAQQYEMAKIEESKEELAFQLIDEARVPEEKWKPQRKRIIMTACVLLLFLGVFVVFFLEYMERLQRPKQS